jgi:hypothetical protein
MVFLQCYANVLALRVQIRVLVVSNVSRLHGEDAVIAAEFAVLAGKPGCAALAEYNVAGYYVFT